VSFQGARTARTVDYGISEEEGGKAVSVPFKSVQRRSVALAAAGVVRPLILLLPAVLAALILVGGSSAANATRLGPPDFVVGATEDQPLGFDDGGAVVYGQMASHRFGAIRLSVDYEPSEPTTVQQQPQLERAIDAANEKGMLVLLSITPGHSTDVTSDANGVKKFAAYTALVARAFPSVNDFIIGNEPNLGRFWFPTFNANGTIASAKTYEAALAASYDALKAVRSDIDVIGLAVSPRGDDRPGSARNTISPVRFIKAVGDAYRKSGRKKPIMDNVALHPYPSANTDSPAKGASWPNVGVPNLDRAQQAFWDGFHGTAQPTFQERGARNAYAAPAVRWILDEAGWQTDTRKLAGYSGNENTPPVDEAAQARYYKSIVQRYVCDPHVAALLFFHWIDETDRDRLQTGLLRADGTIKPAANAVRGAIARGCAAASVGWRHSTTVDGASVTWKPKAGYLFFAKAFEETMFTATATPTKAALKRAKAHRQKMKTVTLKGKLKAYLAHGIKFKAIKLKNANSYTYKVKVTATLNPARTVTLKRTKLQKP
jgi:hypothetical protein